MTLRPFILIQTASLLVAYSAPVPAVEAGTPLPILALTKDDTIITQSCLVTIAPGTVIEDLNRNGVIQISADHVTVRFQTGSELLGATVGTNWDQLRGIGIRVAGHHHVTLENARVHGFRNGLVATKADGLLVAGGDFSDNYRQHLKSTPAAEDGADWLFPHHNDETKWREEYGGAVCIESSTNVTVRDLRVRRGQNGILLDRVNDSAVYDNDCSFLSGWGLALWRSSRNRISRNAFDFCVRGHVEGVYNRGQDSAGILCFEQCNDNVFAENSATHGGDCFFGFAGRNAIGEEWMSQERERLRKETGRQEVEDLIHVPADLAREMSARGCNRNLLVENDFSYAPAHGIEMTFSEGNQFVRNRLVENAICGIWGGYSSGTVISENNFTGNGGMAYGLERGAINMEHSADNLILKNKFLNNKCAIHLWWSDGGALMKFPGVAGTEKGVIGNVIAGNFFEINREAPFPNLGRDAQLIVLQLRDSGPGHVTNNHYFNNRVTLRHPQAIEFAVKPGTEPIRDGKIPAHPIQAYRPLGRKHPVGARKPLRGRDQIILDEWGPWDHESPLLRPARARSSENSFDLFGVRKLTGVKVLQGDVTPVINPETRGGPIQLQLRARPGVTIYRVHLSAEHFEQDLAGTIVAAEWQLRVFPWKVDPREDLAAWRKLAEGPEALAATVSVINFPYGWGGPRDQKLSEAITRNGPGSDHFGMIARTRLHLPKGRWRFRTLSDDGVRVRVNDQPVIENWTWHGPTPNEGVFTQTTDAEVDIVVEHFEIDGYATLRLDIEKAP